MLIVRKKEWAFHCWKVHSYADCELHERRNALLIAGIYRTTIIVLVPQGVATAKALIKIQNCQTRRAAVQRLVPANNICSHPAQSRKQYPQTRFGQCCCIWLQCRMAESRIYQEVWVP